jgi:RimJ/RimL family protein N-acetyltransferase
MKNSFLVGDRIYLRALNEGDVEGGYIQWFNDEEVCANNSHHIFPYTKEKALYYINSSREFKDALVLAVVLKGDDLHIGNIALQNINFISKSAEFAIILGEKNCWGQNYSKEASCLLVKHGFASMNLNRIYCGTSAKNIAMQKLASYLGMVEEGRRRQALYKNGQFVDSIEYGLLRNEFFAKYNLNPS